MMSEIKNFNDMSDTITLKHAFRKISKDKLKRIARDNKYSFANDMKFSAMCKQIISEYKEGKISTQFCNDIKQHAFSPDLDVLDGFFLYLDEKYSIEKNALIKYINTANFSKASRDEEEELIEFSDLDNISGLTQFIASLKKVNYVYDYESNKSKIIYIPKKAIIEIYLNNLIYIQTKNTVVFSDLKGIVQLLLQNYFEDKSLRLSKPILSQRLNIKSTELELLDYFKNINSCTIKFLDMIFDLENLKYNFSEFFVTSITFDHEDSSSGNLDLNARIYSTSFDGENLLEHDEVRGKILKGRQILIVDLQIIYNEVLMNGKTQKHAIEAGISYERGYFRVYIKDNENVNYQVLKEAYTKLKELFIDSFSSINLRNEEKIIEIVRGK